MRYLFFIFLLVSLDSCNGVYHLTSSVIHTKCDDKYSGKIDVSIYSINNYSPISYIWKHGINVVGANEDISNIAASCKPYNLRITFDHSVNPNFYAQHDFFVLNDVSWKVTSNLNPIANGGLSFPGGSFFGSAVSYDELRSTSTYDFMEFVVNDGVTDINPNASSSGAIGFSPVSSPNTLRYFIRFQKNPGGNRIFNIVHYQSGVINNVYSGIYSNGDRFQIVKVGSTIQFKHNNSAYLLTPAGIPITSPENFLVNAFISSSVFRFQSVRTSYGCISGSDVYYSLDRRLNGAYYVVNSPALNLKYTGEYNSGNLNYKVYNWQRTVVQQGAFPKGYGDNRINIGLCGSGYAHDEIYTLEVTNEKNELFMLRFKYRGKQSCPSN